MKKIVLIVLLLTTAVYGQDKKLTLKESLQIGLTNSKAINISESQVKSSEAKVTEVVSQMLPKITLGANYTRLSDIKPFEVTVPISPNPIKIQDAILNNYTLKASIRQPIFTGFRLSSLKHAAEYGSKAEKIEHKKEINEEALRIQTAFWSYYKAEERLGLVKKNLERINEHFEDTKNFYVNGLATKNDMLKLGVQKSNLELKQIEAQNGVDVARAFFNKTIGLKIESKTEIDPGDIKVNPSEFKYDSLLAEAMNKREELQSLSYRIKSAREGVGAAKAGWFPSIYLVGNYYYSKPNQRILPLENTFNDTWDVSISLNWELWDWGHTSSQTTQAEERLLQSKTTLEMLKENIEVEVYQNYLKLLSEFDKVGVAGKTLKQSKENYRITKEKYNQQLATSTELIDAETSLMEAEIQLTNAKIDFEIARVRLEKAVGRKIY